MSDKAVKEALKSARSALGSKDFRTAIKSCEHALALDATHYDALTCLGKAKLGANEHADAEAAYVRAIASQPDRTTAHQGLAELYTVTESLEKLVATLKTLQTLFSGDKDKLKLYKEQLTVAEKKLRGPEPEKEVKKTLSAQRKPEKKTSKGAGQVNRCSVPGCKERLSEKNTAKCKECGMLTCLEHQYPVDHDCTGGKPALAAPKGARPASAAGGGIQILTKKPPAAAPAPAPVAAAPSPPPPTESKAMGELSDGLKKNMVSVGVLADGLMANADGDVGKVMAALLDKIAITQKKAPQADREQALMCMELLCDKLGRGFEPYTLKYLPIVLQLQGDGRGGIPAASIGALNTMLGRLHAPAATLVVPALLKGMDDRAYRVKEGAMQCLQVLAIRSPYQIGLHMPDIFPKLQECLQDTHPKVVEAAEATLDTLATVITQPETLKIMTNLLKAIKKPGENTIVCLDQLMETTFVNSVDAASLAMMLPVVARGLKEPSADLNKKAATTAGNVCALVADARDILPFVPLLLPGITKAVDHSHPDVRTAASRARVSLLTGSGLRDEATIDTLSKASSSADLSAMAVPGFEGPGKGEALVKAELQTLLGEMVNRGRVAQTMFDYLRELLATMVKDARAARGLEEEIKQAVWPLIGTSGADEAATEQMCRTLTKHVATELYSSSEIPDRNYIVRVEGIILAFAGKVLLSKTHLLLERGHRYGLVGQNGMGKTTLLNRVAAGDIKGFPKDTSVYYIQHEILSERNDSVKEFMLGQVPEGTSDAQVESALIDVGFTLVTMAKAVGELSGGWRMKLAIARSMLWNAELLLLDEPTNHLDKAAVAWLAEKINSLTNTTVLLVSHDYDFLNLVCTDIVHIADRALTYYDFGFSEFQKARPEIVAGLPSPEKTVLEAAAAMNSLNLSKANDAPAKAASSNNLEAMDNGAPNGAAAAASEEAAQEAEAAPDAAPRTGLDNVKTTDKPINFPDPGKLEGIVGKRKVVLRMNHVSFQYESSPKPILTDASGTLCLSSRIALIGANGAGKTTMMKLLVGEMQPTEGVGEVWQHHNLRLAYIAQHSMHHLEASLENTPLQYIQNRFYMGRDKELAKMSTMALTEEDKAQMEGRGAIIKVQGRQTRSGNKLWYEVLKIGRKDTDTDWEPLQFLERMHPYVMKLVKNYDEEVKAAQSGMAIRPITSLEVRKHLADFGIDEDLASQKIKRMSGGQRSRLVLAAAMWSMPHLVALDEPTNYLDNDTLAALTTALKHFKGGVMTISHNQAFVHELCTETWLVENGTVTINKLKK